MKTITAITLLAAVTISPALGQTAGAPLEIAENYSSSNWGRNAIWTRWGALGQGMMQNTVQEIPSRATTAGETITLGKIGIKASVSVTFELTK